ncbi:glycosyltransferase family 4 protein [Methylovorus menthalis]|uniref:glycosyltransferase family 4 protein n=1 Tax=Methylovorus menthalis TaxID=1002227 RepID=UPI001E36F4DD|nr:glycosyltransferase family 4 protein [Methylovorus menthalis]MCB4810630.1 glycosyltransferase family 4 protein [Methylovorus menthalis]
MFLKDPDKVRILIVSQYFWPEGFRINEVTRTLVESGEEVDVLTGKPNYPEGVIYPGYNFWKCTHEKNAGITISRVPLIPRGKNSKICLALNYISFIIFGTLIGPWLKRRQKYDVVFVYGVSPLLQALPGLLLGWIKRAPVVIWVQDLWPESLSATGYVKNRFVLWAVEQLVRFIYTHADLLLVQSRAFIEPVSKLASGTPIRYYPNSVDGSFLLRTNDKVPDVPGLDAPFSVMFAGNIGAAQAVHVIVEAATHLKDYPDIQFIVVGDGSCRLSMLEQVNKRGLKNLHLPGRFPVESMPGFMQKASALLVTLADKEIFAATVPNKIQAYMAAGRPIIACVNGEGARLVTEAQAGLAVSAENSKGLAEAVLRMYNMSSAERNKMAENAQAYYLEHFAHEKLVSQLIRHFEDIRTR